MPEEYSDQLCEQPTVPIICFDPADLVRDLWNRRSRIPTTEELTSGDPIVLAHFTSSVLLPDIQALGLQPRSLHERAIEDDLFTDPDCVYLSAQLDKFYMDRAVKQFGGEGIAIVVAVDPSNLRPDENSLSESLSQSLRPEQHFTASVSLLGNCKHFGQIPPSRFLSIYRSDGSVIWRAPEGEV